VIESILVLGTELSLDTATFDLNSLLSSPQLFATVKPDDSLDKAVAQVDSSHEPVLVYNAESFQGLVSLREVLYQSKYPHTTKVKRVMLKPPGLTLEADVFEVAAAMHATRLYALPVFRNRTVMGVIELATLLKWLAADKENVATLAQAVEVREPVTISGSAGVREALELFKKQQVSRLVVVNETGSLSGMISRSQLREAYLTPSNRQRFGRTNDPKTHVFDPAEVIKRDNTPVRRLVVTDVFTGQSAGDRIEIVTRLIKSNYNSVILVDQDRKPAGFLSNRGLLEAIVRLTPPAP
jgi:CBS domain-containing protein